MPKARAVAFAAVTTRPRRASRECKTIGLALVGAAGFVGTAGLDGIVVPATLVSRSACDFAAATRWLGQLGSQMQSTRMLMTSPLR